MAIALFDAELIIARLDAQVVALKKVAGAVDLAAAQADIKNQTPAAWVIELDNRAGANEIASQVSQRDAVRFGVIFAVSNLRDARGEAALADAKPLREAAMTALLGWQPGTGYDLCEYVGGALLALETPVLWWQDVYATGLYLHGA